MTRFVRTSLAPLLLLAPLLVGCPPSTNSGADGPAPPPVDSEAKRQAMVAEENEELAVGALKTLAHAQAQFKRRQRRFGTLQELHEAGLISELLASGTRRGYAIQCQPSRSEPGVSWYAQAYPLQMGDTGERTFFVNHEGTIHSGAGVLEVDGATCSVPGGLSEVGPADESTHERRERKDREHRLLHTVSLGEPLTVGQVKFTPQRIELLRVQGTLGEGDDAQQLESSSAMFVLHYRVDNVSSDQVINPLGGGIDVAQTSYVEDELDNRMPTTWFQEQVAAGAKFDDFHFAQLKPGEHHTSILVAAGPAAANAERFTWRVELQTAHDQSADQAYVRFGIGEVRIPK
jgi:hypothetical protein